jgi:hypothetical protein
MGHHAARRLGARRVDLVPRGRRCVRPGGRALLGFGNDTVECFRGALDADPRFALARAGLAMSLYLNQDAWAVHGIAHVFSERGKHDRGADAILPQIRPLLAAALRAGEPERAPALLAWRLTRRPRPGHCWKEPGRVATAASQRGEAPV